MFIHLSPGAIYIDSAFFTVHSVAVQTKDYPFGFFDLLIGGKLFEIIPRLNAN
jgi:hypothetical protein